MSAVGAAGGAPSEPAPSEPARTPLLFRARLLLRLGGGGLGAGGLALALLAGLELPLARAAAHLHRASVVTSSHALANTGLPSPCQPSGADLGRHARGDG